MTVPKKYNEKFTAILKNIPVILTENPENKGPEAVFQLTPCRTYAIYLYLF